MRIRKHAKLSSIMACGAEVLQAYVCELNQSPWDVMAFPPDTYPPPLHQLEEEDSFAGNGSLADSIGAVESSSAGSMMEDAEARPKFEPTVIDDDSYEVVDNNGKKKRAVVDDCEDGKVGIGFKSRKGGKSVHCGHKNHGTGLHCRNEVKDGKTLCEHHWTMLKSSSNGAASGLASKKAEKGVNNGSRRGGRPRAAGKGNKSVKSNPYEYYYYSGFGPLWGKRRGGGGGGGGGGVGVGEDKGEGSKQTSEAKEDENGTNSTTAATNNTNAAAAAAASASPAVSSPGASSSKNTTPSSRSSSPIEEVELELDYVGEEEEEEEEDVIDDDDDEDDDDDDDDDNNNNNINNNNGDSGSKKRMRKPVKARSLKSLM